MPVSLVQVNTRATRVFMGTLTEGEAIHTALAQIAATEGIHAATFEMLGGLTEVELSAYDFVNRVRHAPLVLQQPLEILSGHGTISRLDGQPHVHTHLVLAYRDETDPRGGRHSIALIGGHAVRAVAFAVEFTLTVYDGVAVDRTPHAATGLSLWRLTGEG